MKTPIFQVDSFTQTAFAGNPAGVCLLSEAQPDVWMQAVAREMNLSETAFLLPEGDGYRLRWFTPLVEVDLCGHATLASAHILWETGRLAKEQPACFQTRSGLLTASYRQGWIEMNFPVQPLIADSPLSGVADALGEPINFAGTNGIDMLVELADEASVRRVQPDFAALNALPARGIIITALASTPGFDFVSRFFAPAVGVNEDPVTGSAHTFLTPYWAARLGKQELNAYQASARGGVLRIRQDGDRVLISGQAVTVMRGELQS